MTAPLEPNPTAWIVQADYPFATMDQPIEGGLPRTELFTREQMQAYGDARARHAAEVERADAERYRWLVENAVIEFDAPHGRVRSDGKDPATTKQPLDNAIAAAIRATEATKEGV